VAYQVAIKPSAKRGLDALPMPVRSRAARAIDALASEPRPRGCKKLRGRDNLYRVRVGTYRIVYEVDDGAALVRVRSVGHRSDVYR